MVTLPIQGSLRNNNICFGWIPKLLLTSLLAQYEEMNNKESCNNKKIEKMKNKPSMSHGVNSIFHLFFFNPSSYIDFICNFTNSGFTLMNYYFDVIYWVFFIYLLINNNLLSTGNVSCTTVVMLAWYLNESSVIKGCPQCSPRLDELWEHNCFITPPVRAQLLSIGGATDQWEAGLGICMVRVKCNISLTSYIITLTPASNRQISEPSTSTSTDQQLHTYQHLPKINIYTNHLLYFQQK